MKIALVKNGRAQLLALAFLLLVSVLFNVLQGRRILRVEAVLEGRVAPLAEGQALPPLYLTDMHGKRITVDYRSAAGTLIYVFSYSCVWCQHNTASFRALSHSIKDARVLCLSLSAPEIGAAAGDVGIDFPAYIPSESTMTSYKLGATPTTIFVSREGKILKEWSGAYTGPTKAAIEDYFKVQLPEA